MIITETNQRYPRFFAAANNTLATIRNFIQETEAVITLKRTEYERTEQERNTRASRSVEDNAPNIEQLAVLSREIIFLKSVVIHYQQKLTQPQRERIHYNTDNHDTDNASTGLIRYQPFPLMRHLRSNHELHNRLEVVNAAEEAEYNLMRQRIQDNDEFVCGLLATDLFFSVLAIITFYFVGLIISHWLLLGMVGALVLGGAVALGIDLLFNDHENEIFDYIDNPNNPEVAVAILIGNNAELHGIPTAQVESGIPMVPVSIL